jgi:antitoxin (DNA-binding transcriptional repressor) of toxin-antitoxin stability system
VVTRNGQPTAELTPVTPRRFASCGSIAAAAERAPRIDAERFRADVDAVVEQDPKEGDHG